MRTSNPALNANVFAQAQGLGVGQSMSIQGTVNKTVVLLFLVVLSASWMWSKAFVAPVMFEGMETAAPQVSQSVYPLMTVGAIAGLIFAIVTFFKKEWAGITGPIYALCEGLFLGGISAIFEMSYPGIVYQAVALTFGTLFCLLMVYKSGLIKVTDNLRMGIVAATGAICLVYFVSIIMSFFGASIPLIHGSGPVGIIFSLVVIGIAAFNLVLDFDFIERGSAMGVPKYYGMVCGVWINGHPGMALYWNLKTARQIAKPKITLKYLCLPT